MPEINMLVTLRARDVNNILQRYSRVHATIAEKAAMYEGLVAELKERIKRAELTQQAEQSTGFDRNSLLER